MLLCNSIQENPPDQLEISPITMIPHKSRLFRAILDLYFLLRLKNGELLPLVNESSVKTAPRVDIDQLGHSLMCMIHVVSQADEEMKIFMSE